MELEGTVLGDSSPHSPLIKTLDSSSPQRHHAPHMSSFTVPGSQLLVSDSDSPLQSECSALTTDRGIADLSLIPCPSETPDEPESNHHSPTSQTESAAPTADNDLAVLSLLPCTWRHRDAKDEMFVALKYKSPNGIPQSLAAPHREDWWHLLAPLTETLYGLRQDWHDLQGLRQDPSEVLQSAIWLHRLRERVGKFGQETRLDDGVRGSARWTMCENEQAFKSAPGELVDRLSWTWGREPYFLITVKPQVQTVDVLWQSRLYAGRDRMPEYESALESLCNGATLNLERREGNVWRDTVHNVIARKIAEAAKSEEGEPMRAYCFETDDENDREERLVNCTHTALYWCEDAIGRAQLLKGYDYDVLSEGSEKHRDAVAWLDLVLEAASGL